MLGVVGGAGLALAASVEGDNATQTREEQVLTQVLSKEQETAGEDGAATKDETVYVLAGADGTVEKIIVSDWIKNSLGGATLTDASELTDIELVKGDESYTLSGDNMRVWDAQGNDIYYQGNIEKELPVGMTVSYKLDGRSVSPGELAGKSGKVTIRFDYTNNQYEYVDIAGKQEKIYVPFAMLTGILLDNDTFTNVEVSNGKLINDGSRTAIVGIAFPGLQENLGIDTDKLQLPDYVEITADVKDFTLGVTVTMTTNELFNKLDTENLDSMDELSASLDELTDGMDQLLDGSSKLYDGLCTLLDKSGELVEGIDKLAAGAGELKKGCGELDTGVGKLQNGAGQLSNGLATLASKNNELNGGAAQVFNTLLATAKTQLEAAGLTVPEMTISNYADVLNGIILFLDESNVYSQALQQVTEAVEAQREYITSQVKEAVKQQVREAVTEKVRAVVASQVTEAVRQAVTSQVTGAVKEAVTAQVEAAVRQTVENQVYQSVT
ncbi:MAG: hypothetical protein IJ833_07870, partial [Lachnospiraceae bacterium]|nr:hypothetical protein [Lachnospiraceae bacterium]